MNQEVKQTKKPWPTKAAMEQVYEMNLWGSNVAGFYSGSGSHDVEIVTPYITAVQSFLKSFKEPITVCDLGCGDFNIGKQLVSYAKNYIAVDIVSDLINHNKAVFNQENLEFHYLNLAIDILPKGDCALVRQVLQHLSNKDVQEIAAKLTDYKYVILTEHLPLGDFVPNKDIISGQGIRLKKQSGINLLLAPFNFKALQETELSRVILGKGKGVVVTTLYQVF